MTEYEYELLDLENKVRDCEGELEEADEYFQSAREDCALWQTSLNRAMDELADFLEKNKEQL